MLQKGTGLRGRARASGVAMGMDDSLFAGHFVWVESLTVTAAFRCHIWLLRVCGRCELGESTTLTRLRA